MERQPNRPTRASVRVLVTLDWCCVVVEGLVNFVSRIFTHSAWSTIDAPLLYGYATSPLDSLHQRTIAPLLPLAAGPSPRPARPTRWRALHRATDGGGGVVDGGRLVGHGGAKALEHPAREWWHVERAFAVAAEGVAVCLGEHLSSRVQEVTASPASGSGCALGDACHVCGAMSCLSSSAPGVGLAAEP